MNNIVRRGLSGGTRTLLASVVAISLAAAAVPAMAQRHGGGGGGHGGGHGWYAGGWGPGLLFGGLVLGLALSQNQYNNAPPYPDPAPYPYPYGYVVPERPAPDYSDRYYAQPVPPSHPAPVPPSEPRSARPPDRPLDRPLDRAPDRPPDRAPGLQRAPDPIIYPSKGQSAAQTETDRRECNRWALSQPRAGAEASVFHRATLACMEGRGYTVR